MGELATIAAGVDTMSGSDALLWTISGDPVMRPTIVALLMLDSSAGLGRGAGPRRQPDRGGASPALAGGHPCPRPGAPAVRGRRVLQSRHPPAAHAPARARGATGRPRHGPDDGHERLRPGVAALGGGPRRGRRHGPRRARHQGPPRPDRRGGRPRRAGPPLRLPRPAWVPCPRCAGARRASVAAAPAGRPGRSGPHRRRRGGRGDPPLPVARPARRGGHVGGPADGPGRPADLADHDRAQLPAPRRGHRPRARHASSAPLRRGAAP